MTKAAAALGGRKKGAKRPPDIHIRPTANGGYIARHTGPEKQDDDPSGQPQEYGLTDKAALLAHLQNHLPDDAEAQAEPGAE